MNVILKLTNNKVNPTITVVKKVYKSDVSDR